MRSRAFTILELLTSLAIVSILLAVLLPALAAAREQSARERCAAHLRCFGPAWSAYLADHDDRFPYVPVQPGWLYAGVRFSAVDGHPVLDPARPLNGYLAGAVRGEAPEVLRCPADRGLTGVAEGFGTGSRTAYRSFGTSYRANDLLLDANLARLACPVLPREGAAPGRGADEPRGLALGEIATVASRLVTMGDPIWAEIREGTGRRADWHGDPSAGNLLFLDGSVKFMSIRPRPRIGPAVFEPMLGGGSDGERD